MLQTDQGQVTIFSLVAIAGATGNISSKNLSVTNCPENWVFHVLFENAEENSCLVNTCERLVTRLAVRLFLTFVYMLSAVPQLVNLPFM